MILVRPNTPLWKNRPASDIVPMCSTPGPLKWVSDIISVTIRPILSGTVPNLSPRISGGILASVQVRTARIATMSAKSRPIPPPQQYVLQISSPLVSALYPRKKPLLAGAACKYIICRKCNNDWYCELVMY